MLDLALVSGGNDTVGVWVRGLAGRITGNGKVVQVGVGKNSGDIMEASGVEMLGILAIFGVNVADGVSGLGGY